MGDAERRRQQAGSLSGGEQQMLAVARSLMSSPRILLVDEPSVGLAPILVSRVIGKIKELKERRQLTVLMAEQNFNQATKIADRGYIIVHGVIEFEGRSHAVHCSGHGLAPAIPRREPKGAGQPAHRGAPADRPAEPVHGSGGMEE